MPIGRIAHTQFPYCMQRTSDAAKWILLNRNYKPVGSLSKDFVDYDASPNVFALDERSVKAIAAAAVNVESDERGKPAAIFFYDDGCVPTSSPTDMRAYFVRIAPLFNAKLPVG